MTDSEIIQGCIKGNPKAQESMYRKFAPRMLGVCVRYMNSREEAEDVMQEAFVKVFKNLRTLENKSSLEAWIRRIMVNTCLNALRSSQRDMSHQDIDELHEQLPDERYDQDNFGVEELLKLVQELPSGYRTVFNLFEIEGFNHQEIADMLGISVNTSKSQLLKARRQLQSKLSRNELN